jgi:NDP-sugar pyrophosphorylase family protein
MNGDICTNFNFKELYESHVRSGAVATIGTYARREKIEFGVLTVSESDQRIVNFQEKPTYDFLVCMGVNAFKRSIIDLIPKGEFFGFDDLMHQMLEKKIAVCSHQFDGLWYDIGRLDDYERMLQDFKTNPTAYLPEGA